jgi:hypothetical protein
MVFEGWKYEISLSSFSKLFLSTNSYSYFKEQTSHCSKSHGNPERWVANISRSHALENTFLVMNLYFLYIE